MTFENLSKIIEGERLNTPSVNAYEKIETKSHLIKRGDLFVGSDEAAIQKAIENGAYGIVCENYPSMIDEEVAWMQVASTDNALIKILRFSLLNSQALFFYFPSIEYSILKQILFKKDIVFIDEPIEKNFKKILQADSDSAFISNNKTFLEDIYPDYLSYHDKEENLLLQTQQSLFLSSFTYDDVHYEDVHLPALFLPQLNTVLHYLKESQHPFDIHRLSFVPHFQPLFISNKYTLQAFGHSEHVFIVESEHDMLASQLRYIQTQAPWAKLLLALPKTEKTKDYDTSDIFYYESLEAVKEIALDKFNFILILANYNELTKILENNKNVHVQSLF